MASSNKETPEDRKARLAEALRANLQRRKSQSRGRKAEDKPAECSPEQKDGSA